MGYFIFSDHYITSEYSSLLEKYSTLPRSPTKINLTKMLITVLLLLRHATWGGGDLIFRLIKQSSKQKRPLSDCNWSFQWLPYHITECILCSINKVLRKHYPPQTLWPCCSCSFSSNCSFWLSQTPQGSFPLMGFPNTSAALNWDFWGVLGISLNRL